MGQRWPDCGQELREWISDVVTKLCEELSSNLVGAYLHGSLAAGSFYPPKSDIDLLFVCYDPLTVEARRAFAKTCVRVSRNRPIVGGLECSVILAKEVSEPRYPMSFEVHFSDEWVTKILFDSVDYSATRSDSDLTAHSQAMLEVGICLSGRPVHDVFGAVAYPDFMKSVELDLDWILEGENILGSPFYGILNCCRILWLWSGHSNRLVPSKEEAALWALNRLPSSLSTLVECALAIYRSDSLVALSDRQTGGQSWDRSLLLSFRDYMMNLRGPKDIP